VNHKRPTTMQVHRVPSILITDANECNVRLHSTKSWLLQVQHSQHRSVELPGRRTASLLSPLGPSLSVQRRYKTRAPA